MQNGRQAWSFLVVAVFCCKYQRFTYILVWLWKGSVGYSIGSHPVLVVLFCFWVTFGTDFLSRVWNIVATLYILVPRGASAKCRTADRPGCFLLVAVFCLDYQRFPCISVWFWKGSGGFSIGSHPVLVVSFYFWVTFGTDFLGRIWNIVAISCILVPRGASAKCKTADRPGPFCPWRCFA